MLVARGVALAGMLTFALLFTLDAWTTELGLLRGAQEMAPLASVIISNLGIHAFVAIKLSVSVAAIGMAFVLFRVWRGMGELFRWTYGIASMSLAGSALIPVVHNLILLGLF